MQQKTNILVIGGTGFIGEYLIRSLRTKKSCEIFVIHKGKLDQKEKISGIRYYELDLSLKNQSANFNMPDADIIIILTRPGKNVIENICSMDTKRLHKIIFASTLLLYPDSGKKQNEKKHPYPITQYEKNKYFEEIQLQKFVKSESIDLCIPRLGNVYGDIKNTGIISKIFESLINNTELEIKGDGKQKRDYIHVEDVANIVNKLIFLKQKNKIEIFNVCTGKSYSILSIIRHVEKIFKKQIPYSLAPGVAEKKSIIGDNSKALLATQYTIRNTIVRGLKKTYLHFINKS